MRLRLPLPQLVLANLNTSLNANLNADLNASLGRRQEAEVVGLAFADAPHTRQ